MMYKLIAGVDFGSDSVRVVLLESGTGATVAEGSTNYARWGKGLYCNAEISRYRQHPLDYIEGLELAMRRVLEKAGSGAGQQVVGLAIDTTGSTPCPIDQYGTPLALLEKFSDNPNAMFHLWKDHTAVEEAKQINDVLSSGQVDYTKFQGIYSSEWFWAKILHTTRSDPSIREIVWTWVEHCDWMAGLLTGNTSPEKMYRGSCAAGHKALWHSSFGGLPPRELLQSLDPFLGDVHDRYADTPLPAGTCLGDITPCWAARLGINPATKVGGGSFDAHAGAVGAGIALKTMVKVIGTSTVDMIIESPSATAGKDLRAYCGQAEDSIVPGYVGLEMGQPAFGDVYSWFRELLMWPLKKMDIPANVMSADNLTVLAEYIDQNILPAVEREAASCIGENLCAIDWFNGRRYPTLNETLRAAVNGLSLSTDASSLFCAIVKGTVFGSKRIYDSLTEQGLDIRRLVAVGGIAKKSKLVMQMMSDVLNIPIMVCREEQVCARGAAIFAAVAAGVFDSVQEAQRVYCEEYSPNYFPDARRHELYSTMYQEYLKLCNSVEFDLSKTTV